MGIRDRGAVGFATTLVLGCQPRAKFPVYLWFVATFVTGFFAGAIFVLWLLLFCPLLI